MSSIGRLSTHILVIALITTISFFDPIFCGGSVSSNSRKSSPVSTSDSEELPLPSRSDKNLSSRSKTAGTRPVRDSLLERDGDNRPSYRSRPRNNDAVIDFDQEGSPSYEVELEEQQRPKRGGGYYFYGHPHSPNFFDRYFDRSRDRSGGGGRRDHEYHSRQSGHDPSWGGKVMSKFRHRTNPLLSAASAMGFAHEHFGSVDDDDVMDNEAAGSSHGGGHGGGGGYGKGVNKSAVGLLGFLSLLSLIQSGLTTTTAAPGGGGRRRRSTNATNLEEMTDFVNADSVPKTGVDIEREAQSQKIAEIVMPLLSSFSFAMQEDQVAEQRLQCVLNEVCSSNHKLVVEFGEHGKDVGLMLGNVLESMVKKMRLVKGSGGGISDHLLKLKYAARTGRNKKNCETHYPKCDK